MGFCRIVDLFRVVCAIFTSPPPERGAADVQTMDFVLSRWPLGDDLSWSVATGAVERQPGLRALVLVGPGSGNRGRGGIVASRRGVQPREGGPPRSGPVPRAAGRSARTRPPGPLRARRAHVWPPRA